MCIQPRARGHLKDVSCLGLEVPLRCRCEPSRVGDTHQTTRNVYLFIHAYVKKDKVWRKKLKKKKPINRFTTWRKKKSLASISIHVTIYAHFLQVPRLSQLPTIQGTRKERRWDACTVSAPSLSHEAVNVHVQFSWLTFQSGKPEYLTGDPLSWKALAISCHGPRAITSAGRWIISKAAASACKTTQWKC